MSAVEVAAGLVRPFVYGLAYEEEFQVASPAAGAELNYAITGAYWERLCAFTFRLVADANAANRFVSLQVLDQDANILAAIPSAAVVTAGQTRDFSFVVEQPAAVGPLGGFFYSPLFSYFLRTGWIVHVEVDQIQVGDQISRVNGIRERFPTGKLGYPTGGVTLEEVAAATMFAT